MVRRKARRSIRDDLSQPFVHYYLNHTSPYAVYNSTVRMLCVITAARAHPLLQLDIQLPFTNELYRHDKPVYVGRLARFHGILTHHANPLGHLGLNLYGTNPACNIYHDGLHYHFIKHGFFTCNADLCLCMAYTEAVMTYMDVEFDAVLILPPTTALLRHFTQIFAKNCKEKDLGSPTSYLGWTLKRDGLAAIHASQSTQVTKALERAVLSNSKHSVRPLPRTTYFDPVNPSPNIPDAERLTFQSLLCDLRYTNDSARPDIHAFTAYLTGHNYELVNPTVRPIHTHPILMNFI